LEEQLAYHKEDENKMGEYESRFAIIGEELKRLNGVLRNKTE